MTMQRKMTKRAALWYLCWNTHLNLFCIWCCLFYILDVKVCIIFYLDVEGFLFILCLFSTKAKKKKEKLNEIEEEKISYFKFLYSYLKF